MNPKQLAKNAVLNLFRNLIVMSRRFTSTYSRSGIPILFFLILFVIYHLPEALQNYFHKPLILIMELVMLLFMAIAFYFGRQFHHNGLKLYGLFSFRQQWRNLTKGLLIGMLIAVLANLIPVGLGWNEISVRMNWPQLILQVLLIAIGTLLPSLAEDILTRGYLRAFWPKRWKLYGLIPVSALVYVLNHISRIGKPDVMLYLFILGLLLMWSYYQTGTLWLTLGIHWGSNIAYQFFANLVSTHSIRETGLENYILAGCYLLGFLLVFLLSRLRFLA